ncbi:GNVR domain-containing protein [Veillonella sp. AS16]|uniref:GumC family protein n=1 Tax=Veillonella sp. AS16 TaxID=936589 RepID=UPI0003E276AF|nr:GNVR domain-containing protein [Veillonella sp. AS16]ETS93535.1 chain length determinant protein [Veillonella sp. AS16]
MEQIIDLQEVAKLLVRKRRKILNITAVCILLGGTYVLLAPATYQSTSMLRIKQAQDLGNSVLSSPNGFTDTMARQLMNTDAEILKSRNVVEPLMASIEEQDGEGSVPTYEEFVKNRIETKPFKETELLQVNVTGRTPEQAQNANQFLIDTFLKRLAELSHVEQRATREFLQKRVVSAKAELDEAEKRLQQFQVDNNVYSTSDQMRGLTDTITLIDKEKAQNKLDLETAQAALGSINEQLGSAGRSIADSSTVQAYKTQLAELESRKASYVGKYTDEHLVMKELNQQIAEAKNGLNTEINAIATQQAPSSNSAQQGLLADKFKNEAALAVAQGKETALANLDKTNEEAMKSLPEKERGYIKAKRDVDVAQDIYSMLSKRLEEAKVAEVMVPNEVQIVDAPTLPEKTVAPRSILILVGSAIIGLILGCLYVLGQSLWNRKIQSVQEVDSILGVQNLGVIPNHQRKDYKDYEESGSRMAVWWRKLRG